MITTAASPGHPSLTGLLRGLFPHASAGSSEEFGLDAGGSQPLLYRLPQGDVPAAPQNLGSCLCLQITQPTQAKACRLQQEQYQVLGSQFKKAAATK